MFQTSFRKGLVLACTALFFIQANRVSAQPDVLPSSVDIRLVQGTTPAQLLLQVKLHTTDPFGGIFSALTVTIRYDAASGSALGAGTSFCNAWSSFTPTPVVVNNGIAYRTYNGFGITRLDDSEFDGGCGTALPVETWFTITTIPVAGTTCTAFTLGNDAYTNAENRDYYISMAGINVTGEVVGGPLNGGNCVNDCLGVSGGTALPGTPCDDGNSSTENDLWGNDCVCAGTAIVFDCPGLQANIGDACDDGNANTTGDVVTSECTCVGTVVYDCPDLQANIGDACNDGNANTTDDVVTPECTCVGTVVYDCPNLHANIGDACDDGDANTTGDVVTSECTCVGTVVYDCPNLQANIGDACDDGNANTTGDVVTSECTCVGTVVYDCPNLQANIGDACDDGNANTTEDVVTSECTCVGTVVYDCPNLQANIGDACNDNDSTTEADVINSECVCVGTSTVGVAERIGNSALLLHLYPNPSGTGQASLHMEGLVTGSELAWIEVRDASGRMIYRSSVQAINGVLDRQMDLSGKASQGIYWVEVSVGQDRVVQRWVVL
jgi:hypothetical protein